MLKHISICIDTLQYEAHDSKYKASTRLHLIRQPFTQLKGIQCVMKTTVEEEIIPTEPQSWLVSRVDLAAVRRIFAWQHLGRVGGKALVKCARYTEVIGEVAQEERALKSVPSVIFTSSGRHGLFVVSATHATPKPKPEPSKTRRTAEGAEFTTKRGIDYIVNLASKAIWYILASKLLNTETDRGSSKVWLLLQRGFN